MGYDKVYKEGLNIKTPLNLNLQEIATSVLRDGIENYDKRKGWRGPIKNINFSNQNWKSSKKNNLEKKIGWKIARVVKEDDTGIEIETENNKIGKINLNNVDWIKTNENGKKFKIGDLIYVKETVNSFYDVKQLPSVNGA